MTMSTAPRDQSQLLSTATRVAPAKRPREVVWTLTKPGAEMRAELVGQGEYGWELQLLRDGELRYGRLFQLRADAETEATVCRRELEARGWR